MKVLILVLLCVAAANARWSVYSTDNGVQGRHHDEDHDEGHDAMDWWEHAVFYQVKWSK